MARLRRSTPDVATAGADLASSLTDLAAAVGRWVALQPVAQELPVYAERARRASTETLGQAGEWTSTTAGRAKAATASAASATKTGVLNLLLVALLLWWVDRMLTSGEED
jgi:hypothetical protein